MNRKLTKVEERILNGFKSLFNRKHICPSNRTLGKKVKISEETVRVNLWKLVRAGYLKVNHKLIRHKFYL